MTSSDNAGASLGGASGTRLRRHLGWPLLLVVLSSAASGRPAVPIAVEISGSPSQPTLAWAIKTGIRGDQWTALLMVEHDLWVGLVTPKIHLGVLNAAIGVDFRYFDERIHSSIAVGTSTLLQRTVLDEAGQTGFYVNIRPLGLRFPLPVAQLRLIFDPLHFSMSAPVLSSVPLFVVAYKTSLALEISL